MKIKDIQMTDKIKNKIKIGNKEEDARYYQVLAYLIFGHLEESVFKDLAGYEVPANTFTFAANVGDFLFKKDTSYDVIKAGESDTSDERSNRNDEVEKKVDQIKKYFEIWKQNPDKQENLRSYVETKKANIDIPSGWEKCNKTDLKIVEQCKNEEEIREQVTKQMIVYRKYSDNERFCSSQRMTWSVLQSATNKYFEIWKNKEEYQECDIEDIIKNLNSICGSDKCNQLKEIISQWNNEIKGVSSMQSEGIVTIVENSIKENKQVIFSGAPGTGKTYSVRKYVKDATDNDESRYKFVQFHPSYDYSDFVEGLRPVVLKGQTEPTFVRMDGVFKAFCRHIVEENDKIVEENDKKRTIIL